ncbi:MAG: calcium-binding protein, partial [Cyanobacteria bacterium P01_D01_bin.123]
LYGGSGNDWLFGEAGNDYLRGEADNDYLYGGSGNDNLYGDAGNDYLRGVDSSTYGSGEIDTLTGGSGSDRFILGTSSKTFYNDGQLYSSGTSDYALIKDFSSVYDQIEVDGHQADYILYVGNYGFGSSGSDTKIVLRNPFNGPHEVIAYAQDVVLSTSDFVYLG